jgi:hypothetical protein
LSDADIFYVDVPLLALFVVVAVLLGATTVAWYLWARPENVNHERLLGLQTADWQAPHELRSHATPRNVRFTTAGRIFLFVIATISAGLTGFGFALIPDMRREQRDNELIQTEGVPSAATVTRRWTSTGKTTCYNVLYTYETGGAPYRGQAVVSRPVYDRSFAGSTVAIRYLPSRPGVSRMDDGNYTSPWMKLMIFVPAVFMLAVPWRLVLMKNLLMWGTPVGAIVTRSARVKGGRSIRYQFLDGSGQLVTGRDIVESSTAPEEGEVITVLFDRDRLVKTARYPLRMVELDRF